MILPSGLARGETVLAYVISGGFNRYLPPADNVQRTPNPAWVFEAGVDAEQAFLEQLAAVGGRAQVANVSVYRVYYDVEPLEAIRPARGTTNPNTRTDAHAQIRRYQLGE